MVYSLINFLISFEMCCTPKQSKYKLHYYLLHAKQSNEFQYQNTH